MPSPDFNWNHPEIIDSTIEDDGKELKVLSEEEVADLFSKIDFGFRTPLNSFENFLNLSTEDKKDAPFIEKEVMIEECFNLYNLFISRLSSNIDTLRNHLGFDGVKEILELEEAFLQKFKDFNLTRENIIEFSRSYHGDPSASVNAKVFFKEVKDLTELFRRLPLYERYRKPFEKQPGKRKERQLAYLDPDDGKRFSDIK